MGFNCGIVGLPNVGKSTLFNALTQSATAEAANYPFCTIEPNVGRVPVPDDRLRTIGISVCRFTVRGPRTNEATAANTPANPKSVGKDALSLQRENARKLACISRAVGNRDSH